MNVVARFLPARWVAGVFLPCILTLLLGMPSPAVADGGSIVGGIFGALMNAAIQQQAQKGWQKVDRDMKDCLTRRINVTTEQLVQEGIRPSDSRLTPHFQACRQYLADSERKRVQEEADVQYRERQEKKSAEAKRKAEKAAKKSAVAHAARAKAQKAALHQALVDKYGDEIAATIEAGKVKIGMSKEAAIAAKGKPKSKEVIPPNDELWYYRSGRVAFNNGRVSYVGH